MNLRVWPDRDLSLINTYAATSRLERAEKCARTIISYLHVPSYLIGRQRYRREIHDYLFMGRLMGDRAERRALRLLDVGQ